MLPFEENNIEDYKLVLRIENILWELITGSLKEELGKTRLDLRNNKLTDVSLLTGLKQWEWYALENTKLTDEQLKHLAGFFSCFTESSFERFQKLKQQNPEIYAVMKYINQLDPADWEECINLSYADNYLFVMALLLYTFLNQPPHLT